MTDNKIELLLNTLDLDTIDNMTIEDMEYLKSRKSDLIELMYDSYKLGYARALKQIDRKGN